MCRNLENVSNLPPVFTRIMSIWVSEASSETQAPEYHLETVQSEWFSRWCAHRREANKSKHHFEVIMMVGFYMVVSEMQHFGDFKNSSWSSLLLYLAYWASIECSKMKRISRPNYAFNLFPATPPTKSTKSKPLLSCCTTRKSERRLVRMSIENTGPVWVSDTSPLPKLQKIDGTDQLDKAYTGKIPTQTTDETT